MLIKSALLTVIVFFGSLTLAEAQYFATGAPGPGTAIGWNYGHITQCATYSDSVGTTYYYAFFQGGGYVVTNNPAFVLVGAPACQTGNLAALYVYSLSPFLWNWIATYPNK